MTRKQAMDIIFNSTPLEEVLQFNEMPDMFDVVGMVGGDVLHYRIMKSDGSVYEK